MCTGFPGASNDRAQGGAGPCPPRESPEGAIVHDLFSFAICSFAGRGDGRFPRLVAGFDLSSGRI